MFEKHTFRQNGFTPRTHAHGIRRDRTHTRKEHRLWRMDVCSPSANGCDVLAPGQQLIGLSPFSRATPTSTATIARPTVTTFKTTFFLPLGVSSGARAVPFMYRVRCQHRYLHYRIAGSCACRRHAVHPSTISPTCRISYSWRHAAPRRNLLTLCRTYCLCPCLWRHPATAIL